jgi:hypothetical protein
MLAYSIAFGFKGGALIYAPGFLLVWTFCTGLFKTLFGLILIIIS